MPLGMEVGLGPGDFVFDGDPAAPQKKRPSPNPIFAHVYCGGNGWVDQDATWYGGKPGPRRRCVRWGVLNTTGCVLCLLQELHSQFKCLSIALLQTEWRGLSVGLSVCHGNEQCKNS